MATDWKKIRALNGSQESGFEELCCQLAASESYPAGSCFIRKGTPDAGVECFWTRPNSDEDAWQAKYFLGPPTPSQWSQIDESVETALDKHPQLKRYNVCIPIDRSDRRLPNEKTVLDKWTERVIKWRKLAAKKRMSVEFEFWGSSELVSRLGRDEHRGRHWFWFSSEQFTLSWFRERLSVAVRNAGEKYTPVVNVQLPITSKFAALGRTQVFYNNINRLYTKIREASDRIRSGLLPEQFSEVVTLVTSSVATISRHLDAALVHLPNTTHKDQFIPIAWETIAEVSRPLSNTLTEVVRQARKTQSKKIVDPSSEENEKLTSANRVVQETCWKLDNLLDVVEELLNFAESDEAQLSNRPALLLVGEAGQGKTHLFCDVAERDMQDDRPRLLLHGSHFVEGEPWAQVVQQLELNCSAKELLGALDAAGQAYGHRVIILIDALNEGPGRQIWIKHLAGMLERVGRLPGVGLAVSVRKSYEDIVIPDGTVPRSMTRIVHEGFAEQEEQAVHMYFTHYGIQPTAPALVPEFTNPLFLKLFCQCVKENGWSRVPAGLRGITAILDMLLDATNKRLSVPERMDYDRASHPVRRATEAVIAEIAKRNNYYLPRTIAVEIVNSIHPTFGNDQSLFRNLVSEGILSENRWPTLQGFEEVVSFAYERFTDHLLAKHLLGQDQTFKSLKSTFRSTGRIGSRLKDLSSTWQNAGLIEALSIQLPERVGKELFEMAPKAADFTAVREGFVKSLVWRASDAFTEVTTEKIDEFLSSSILLNDLLNAIVTLGPVPNHPQNANRLHNFLVGYGMAQRDSWWSVFLHHEWYANRSVKRLVDWVSDTPHLNSLNDEVVQLTGITLAWCLTTSNRFFRDRATKSLVRLFENRLLQMASLLERFWEVNDPYVLERLVAAAYGSAMRSQNCTGLRELALVVHDNVFASAKLLPQLLTRDFARGIVEFSRYRGLLTQDECQGATPPYKSDWPSIAIPTEQDLEYLDWKNNPNKDQKELRDLYASITGDGFSDFSTYVVGDLHEWTNVRIGENSTKPVKLQIEEFLSQLTKLQRKAIEDYKAFHEEIGLFRLIRLESPEPEYTEEQLSEALAEVEQMVLKKLSRRSPSDIDFFHRVVKPFVTEPRSFEDTNAFDSKLARRWMFQRVLDYGWKEQLFERFEREVRYFDRGRMDRKPERIGKKYQWIAYYELLARLSDNFYVRNDSYNEESELTISQGPWDIGGGHKREIDPSVIIRSTPFAVERSGQVWWAPSNYSDWHAAKNDLDWLKISSDLPPIEPLLSVIDTHGQEWLVLDTHLEWKSPAPAGHREYEAPRKMIWYFIRSYLVRKPDASKFFRWAKQQDFMNRWMPEPQDVYQSFLGECYWSQPFASEFRMDWTKSSYRNMPCEVLVTAIDHLTESSSHDCSIDETFRISLPAPQIVNGMGLRMRGFEGELIDSEGRVTVFDSSVRRAGPGALLVRREAFVRYLMDNDLELVWTLLGEKQRIGGDEPNSLGWLQFSGAYRIGKKGIEGSRHCEYRTRAR